MTDEAGFTLADLRHDLVPLLGNAIKETGGAYMYGIRLQDMNRAELAACVIAMTHYAARKSPYMDARLADLTGDRK